MQVNFGKSVRYKEVKLSNLISGYALKVEILHEVG